MTAEVPIAQRLEKQYRIPASVILAVSAQESDWGRNSSTYFGEKRGTRAVPSVSLVTHEVIKRKPIEIRDDFVVYSSYATAAEGFCRFLKTNPRYAKALTEVDNVPAFVHELARARYASDAYYEGALLQKINAFQLQRYDHL